MKMKVQHNKIYSFVAKAMMRGKLVALNACIRKEKRF